MKSNIISRHIRVPRQAEVWGNAVFSHGRAKAPSGFHRPFVFSGKGRKRIRLCFCESGQYVVIRFRTVAKSPVRTEMRRFVLRKCEERKEYRSVIFLRPVGSSGAGLFAVGRNWFPEAVQGLGAESSWMGIESAGDGNGHPHGQTAGLALTGDTKARIGAEFFRGKEKCRGRLRLGRGSFARAGR